ncbi:MAG: gamma-D-glutamyl-L-lysine dipeptidyl-peptidase [Tepidanaerobacteraceae bacterium]|nr:gamma-D-glutamyl-L-lysine dipeptidyl-peptidase [Tepidanaerobacteraceae bacterium]
MGKRGYGFIKHEFCNVGKEPYKILGKNLVTQARLSEPIQILEEKAHWYYIEMSDGYRGWIHSANAEQVSEKMWREWLEKPHVLVTDSFCPILSCANLKSINSAVMAARLRLIGENAEYYLVALPDGQAGMLPKTAGIVIQSFDEIPKGTYDSIIETGKKFIGLPYFWGGTTPYGFDCSGFVQTLFLINGFKLPRDANQQFEFKKGEPVKERKELEKGDAVFFSTSDSEPSHVGIYMGNGEYIHSSGKSGVCINSFYPQAHNYREDLDKSYIGARRYRL